MPTHHAAHAQRRQRLAVFSIALLLLLAGVGIALFATGTLLPSTSAGEEPRPLPEPSADVVVTGPAIREEAPAASEAVHSGQAVPQPARTAVAVPLEVPTAPVASTPAVAAKPKSPYGRFTLVGDAEGVTGHGFGSCVAIEGDTAVIGAPGYTQGSFVRGAAYVYERRDGVWTQTQRLHSPIFGGGGFARRVAVAGGAIVVVGQGSDIDTFVRDEGNSWRLASQTRMPSGLRWDAVARGDTLAVSGNSVYVWRRKGDGWQQVGSIDAPADDSRARFGGWLSLDGDSLAVHSDGAGATYVYRRAGEGFARTPELTSRMPANQEAQGVLAAQGTALLQLGDPGLTIAERSETGWHQMTALGIRDGSWGLLHNERGVASDGPLVVSVETDLRVPAFAVWQRRDDGWYRTTIAAPQVPRDTGVAVWHPRIAFSGRTVVATTGWDPSGSGRAWFFDITDDDLDRATKVEPLAR